MYKLTVEIEKSDHNGYCTGAECEYTSELVTKTFSSSELGSIGDIFKTLKSFTTKNGDVFLDLYDEEIKIQIPLDKFFEEDINVQGELGSNYCSLDGYCEENLLERHDYRINLISVEVL